MDPTLREKIEMAIATEISKALDAGTLDENTAEDAGADFYELLESYSDQPIFVEDFATYIRKYPFASVVGDYYAAHVDNRNTEDQINTIRKQLQQFTST